MDGGLEVFFGEGKTGTGFEVALESGCFFLAWESDGGFQFPRSMLRGMGRTFGIVLGQPSVEIVGEANIALFGATQAADVIDGPHGVILGFGPPSPRLRGAPFVLLFRKGGLPPVVRNARRVVGDTGLEPVTPSMSRKCSSQLS